MNSLSSGHGATVNGHASWGRSHLLAGNNNASFASGGRPHHTPLPRAPPPAGPAQSPSPPSSALSQVARESSLTCFPFCSIIAWPPWPGPPPSAFSSLRWLLRRCHPDGPAFSAPLHYPCHPSVLRSAFSTVSCHSRWLDCRISSFASAFEVLPGPALGYVTGGRT